MPLLWVLREECRFHRYQVRLRIAECGACTVHVNGAPVRSCFVRSAVVAAAQVTTIEGLSTDSRHPVQQAWIEEQVPQCGYCQAGQIMVASALLARHPQPTDADIDREMTNICRCGTYAEIRSAIRKASALMSKG